MATGLTSNYSIPYPLSTDPVNVAGDIQQLAEKFDLNLTEWTQDTSAGMWTSGGTFSNGLQAPTYNDSTGKMSMTLAQDIRTSASPTFVGLTLTGDAAINGGDITTSQTTFNLINTTTTTLNIGGAATTLNIGNGSGQTNFAGHVNIATGKQYEINNVSVLTATTLGSSVVNSSLQTVGTISTGTWNATTIAVNKGGTGLTSYTVGDLVYASGSTTLAKLAGVATGNALISGGVGLAPSWGKIGLTTHVSGTLPVANGGTGVTTSTGTGNVVLSASPTLSGTPLAPTAGVDTNTTQIATTAFVIGQGYLKSSTASSTYAPLASPTFTGTVTAAILDLTTAATTTAASHYWVATGSDGVVRPKTLANVKTEIVTTAAVNTAAATTVGTVTSGTWAATDIGLAHGGTNASLTAVAGGVIYSTSTAMAITSAGTAGQVLTSNGTSAPTWQDAAAGGGSADVATVLMFAGM